MYRTTWTLPTFLYLVCYWAFLSTIFIRSRAKKFLHAPNRYSNFCQQIVHYKFKKYFNILLQKTIKSYPLIETAFILAQSTFSKHSNFNAFTKTLWSNNLFLRKISKIFETYFNLKNLIIRCTLFLLRGGLIVFIPLKEHLKHCRCLVKSVKMLITQLSTF